MVEVWRRRGLNARSTKMENGKLGWLLSGGVLHVQQGVVAFAIHYVTVQPPYESNGATSSAAPPDAHCTTLIS